MDVFVNEVTKFVEMEQLNEQRSVTMVITGQEMGVVLPVILKLLHVKFYFPMIVW